MDQRSKALPVFFADETSVSVADSIWLLTRFANSWPSSVCSSSSFIVSSSKAIRYFCGAIPIACALSRNSSWRPRGIVSSSFPARSFSWRSISARMRYAFGCMISENSRRPTISAFMERLFSSAVALRRSRSPSGMRSRNLSSSSFGVLACLPMGNSILSFRYKINDIETI